jgi:hypothetical protein
MSKSFLTNEKGQWVGAVKQTSDTVTSYLDPKGALVARVHDNRTYNAKGEFKGFGDQGQRLLGEKK